MKLPVETTRALCKPIQSGEVPLELNCFAPRGSDSPKQVGRLNEGDRAIIRGDDQALTVGVERDGKHLNLRLDVPDSLAHVLPQQQSAILKNVRDLAGIQEISMESNSRSRAARRFLSRSARTH